MAGLDLVDQLVGEVVDRRLAIGRVHPHAATPLLGQAIIVERIAPLGLDGALRHQRRRGVEIECAEYLARAAEPLAGRVPLDFPGAALFRRGKDVETDALAAQRPLAKLSELVLENLLG